MNYTTFKFTPKGLKHLKESCRSSGRESSLSQYKRFKEQVWKNYDFSEDREYKVLREARKSILGPALQDFLNQQFSKGVNYNPQNKDSVAKLYRDFTSWDGFTRLGITPSPYQVKQAAIALGSEMFGSMNSPLTGHRVEELTQLQQNASEISPPVGTNRLLKYEQQFNQMVESAEETAEEEESSVDRKYRLLYQMVRGAVSGRLQKNSTIIAGAAGIGKTHTAQKALEDLGYTKAKGDSLSSDKEYLYNQGSIGNSATNIIAFFYKHRNDEIIVLDDCDSFLAQDDDELQNLLKGLLTTGKQGGMVTISAGIAKRVSNILEKNGYKDKPKRLKESTSELLLNHLRENYLDLSGVYDTSENDKPVRGKEKKEEKNQVEEESIEQEEEVEEGFTFENPFSFTSKLVCITNLSLDQLNTAVRSRSNCYEIYLTNEEFMAQLKKVIKFLGTKDSPLPAEEYNAYKEFCYDLFCAAIESAGSGYPLFGVVPKINIDLEFRVLLTVIDGCIMETLDKSILDMTDLEKTKLAVKLYKGYIIPTLAGATN